MITGSFTVGWDGDLTLGDLAILKDLHLCQSTKLAFACGVALLFVPYVSLPLCCLPRANCYLPFRPLHPRACYGNPWEAPGLGHPPGLPEPSCTSHRCLLACFMPTRLWALLRLATIFPQPERCQAHGSHSIDICRMNDMVSKDETGKNYK